MVADVIGIVAPLSTLYNESAALNDTKRLGETRDVGEKAQTLAGGEAPCYTLSGNLAVLRVMRYTDRHPGHV